MTGFALAAVRRFVLALIAKVGQRGQIVVHLKHDVAAATAVAAVRSAGRNIFFTMKRDRAVAAVAGFDLDFCDIDKQNRILHSSDNLTNIILF